MGVDGARGLRLPRYARNDVGVELNRLEEADDAGVFVVVSVFGFYGCDDGEDQIDYGEDWKENETDPNEEKYEGDKHVDGDVYLEIDGFSSLFVDEGVFFSFDGPDDDGCDNISEGKGHSSECAEVAHHGPHGHVGIGFFSDVGHGNSSFSSLDLAKGGKVSVWE